MGAPFSGAIREPVILHHAHIEDEESLNMSLHDHFDKEEGGEKRSAFGSAFEFASSWGELLLHRGNRGMVSQPRGPDSHLFQFFLWKLSLRRF